MLICQLDEPISSRSRRSWFDQGLMLSVTVLRRLDSFISGWSPKSLHRIFRVVSSSFLLSQPPGGQLPALGTAA